MGILARLYERASGVRMTEGGSRVLARFGPYLAGMLTAKAVLVLGQVLMSRLLGPAEFGRFAIVWTVATLLAFPVATAWGGAFVRYAAGQPHLTWIPLFRWTVFVTLASTSALALGVAAASPLIARALDVPMVLPVAGAGLGLCMAVWMLAKTLCQAREDWPRFVTVELAWGSGLLVGAVALASLGKLNWASASLACALAYGAGALSAKRHAVAAAAERGTQTSAPLGRFGRFALVTGVATTIFMFGDRFVVQHFLGSDEVGVYQLYSTATLGLAGMLATLITNFVYPLFARGNRRTFADVIGRTVIWAAPLVFAAFFLAGALQVYLARFPFRPTLLAVASVSATFSMITAPLASLIMSHGVDGSRTVARVSLVSLCVFVLGVTPAVRLYGVMGALGLQGIVLLTMLLQFGKVLRRPH